LIVKLPEVTFIEEEGKVEATKEKTISLELLSTPLSATYVVFDEYVIYFYIHIIKKKDIEIINYIYILYLLFSF